MLEPKKKRQHFVPQFLLRAFASDPDRRQLSIFYLKTGRSIAGASLAAQCYEDYFYGVDPQLENAFMEAEGKVSAVLGNLEPERLGSIDADGLYQLRQFLHYQSLRTTGAAEATNDFADMMIKAVATQTPDGPPPDLDKVRIKLKGAQFQALYTAATTTPLLLDLAVKFIMRAGPPGFILGDNPAVVCNQWAENHPKFKTYGGLSARAARGIQMFLPLSPKVCLAVYDPVVYAVGNEASRVRIIGEGDVHLLNRLQILSAMNCTYYHSEWSTLADLEQLRSERTARKLPIVSITPKFERPNGTLSQILQAEMPDLRIGGAFAFAKTLDTASYDGYDAPIVPLRSKELPMLLESYRKYVEQQHRPSPTSRGKAKTKMPVEES